jgi:hypothetical protein
LWPSVETSESARAAVRQAFWAAVICSIVTICFVVLNLFAPPADPRLQFEPDVLLDATLFAIIAFGIWKESRVAAVCGLALYLIERLYAWTLVGFENPIVPVILTCGFISGVRGTFALGRQASQKTVDAITSRVPSELDDTASREKAGT